MFEVLSGGGHGPYDTPLVVVDKYSGFGQVFKADIASLVLE